EQEFSGTDAFFAWTFANKRPLWQTLLSLSWSVLTLAICLFPVYSVADIVLDEVILGCQDRKVI
ncbi:hypothetical protein Tco_1283203, partial [Tanacetum coccineum]